MRILYIFRSLAVYGGIERILVDKMNFIAKQYGMEVYLFTSDQGPRPVPYILSESVRHEDLGICFYHQYRFHGLRRLMVARKMNRKYRHLLADRFSRIQPDLIICTTTDKIGTIVKLKGNIPLIVESHSICTKTLNHGRNWLHRKFYRICFLRCLSNVDTLVALTEGDAKEWRKYHPHVMVIPNFVHPHDPGITDYNSKKALFVGRFDYQKRVQDAISIWKKVREHHPDWTLEIYGEGDLHKEIYSLALSAGGIVVHPPISQIFQAYQGCSFLISTSLFEPFGLVIPEAMSCGLPVVAFDCPYGPADIITDGEDGYVIRCRDVKLFVERVCQLIENYDLRQKMGQAAILSSHRYQAEYVMSLWQSLFLKYTK